jgi:hypothetical protein
VATARCLVFCLAVFLSALVQRPHVYSPQLTPTPPCFRFMQVLAPVSTATTSFMSLLNTSSSVIHYLVLGELPFGYGAAVFAVGALGKCFDVTLMLFVIASVPNS